MTTALGKTLGVTKKQIALIKKAEKRLTLEAMQALIAGNEEEFKALIAERDCQTSWLRVYA